MLVTFIFTDKSQIAMDGEQTQSDAPPSFLPPPFDSEPPPIDDEFVEGLLSRHFRRLPCGKLDEGALLPLDYGDGANLTKLVKVAPKIKQKNVP